MKYVMALIKLKALGIPTNLTNSITFPKIDLEEFGKRLRDSGDLKQMVEFVQTHNEYSMTDVWKSSPNAIRILREMRAEKNA